MFIHHFYEKKQDFNQSNGSINNSLNDQFN